MNPSTRSLLVALGCGLLFAVGLGVAGMTNPHKVLNFLDVFGDWDPSLALVMLAAILVYAPAYQLSKRRAAPKLGARFHWPTSKDVDSKLIAGAVMFGVGWGLAGYCPGPAVVAATVGSGPVLVFAAAMVAGMFVHRQIGRGRGRGRDGQASSGS
ncbi:DUF6691 family protein [Enhygromyxa salina]|uniref:YeeE/YedE family protein n=1 Tax=Enhygromyxa salina TaxID=215803 RepID=A0A2S9YRU7_9BACT|nr:DUF6691 family protein [Enhygromyxa salina]PRQ07824.1 hypothetical protein ENSA7_24960 [Enhygromyxa salina]